MDITTHEEQDYLVEILSEESSGDVWIGLTSSAIAEPLFWSDGSALNFTAWVEHARNENEMCVRMRASENFKWDDRPCDYNFGYLCEFQRN